MQNREGGDEARQRSETVGGVLTLTCVKCGLEQHLDAGPPPADLVCEKCGGTVFRSFFTPESADEAARDFEETTGRDTRTDQASTDTRPGDLIDLNRD
jgi:hypothetical protein